MPLLRTLSACLLLLVASRSAAYNIQVDFADAGYWEPGLITYPVRNFTFGSSAVFSKTQFEAYYYLNDLPSYSLRTYGALIVGSGPAYMEVTTTWLRQGATVDASSTYLNPYAYNVDFIVNSAFVNGAVSGSNNYLGIRVKDRSGSWHYGQMRFEFGTIAGASLAIAYLGGSLSESSDVSVVTTSVNGPIVVPEPATYGLALGAIAIAAVALRRRASRR